MAFMPRRREFQFVTSSFLLPVVRPGATNSVLVPSSDARSPLPVRSFREFELQKGGCDRGPVGAPQMESNPDKNP